MRDKPRSLFMVFIIAFGVLIVSPRFLLGEDASTVSPKFLTVEEKKSASDHHYTIFHRNSCSISYEISRPEKNSKEILLCIPAAFTDLQTYGVDGACISNGERCNKKVNHTLGGAFKIMKGQCAIFPTNSGQLLTDSMLSDIASAKGSLFQQIQMITNGKKATYKDKSNFQRRGIVEMKDKSWAVVESLEAITLAEFTDDLAELGAYNALYTDMGAWDEGWYRDPSSQKLVTTGQLRTETAKQSNWIIFKAK
jgi:hypothetical protein